MQAVGRFEVFAHGDRIFLHSSIKSDMQPIHFLIMYEPHPGPLGLARVAVFLGSRASLPAAGARSAAFASLPRAGSPRSQEGSPRPRGNCGTRMRLVRNQDTLCFN